MNDLNKIRNILMNEMGLSREFIRDEAEKIVTTTAEKHLLQLIQNGKLGEIMVDAVNAETARNHGSYKEHMKCIVRDAAYEAAKDWCAKNIIIKQRE